jgi:hypothetical protein
VRVSDKIIPPLPPTIVSTSRFVSPFITEDLDAKYKYLYEFRKMQA